jgi:hypothetical protein
MRPTSLPLAPPPESPAINNARTTLVVRLGLIVLAILGVISIFGEPLLGLGAAGGDLAGAPGPADPTGASTESASTSSAR